MIVLLPLLLVASGFFSGGETALFRLSRHQQLQLSRSPGIAAAAIARLLHDRNAFLVTVLLGNMFINVLYFVISSVLVLGLEERNLLNATAGGILNIGALLLLILFGEVLPKLIAARYSLGWSKFAAVPLLTVYRVLSPLRVLLRGFILDPLGRLVAPLHEQAQLSPKELESLLELSQHSGVIDDQEEKMLQQVLALSQLRVQDLMTPRVDIVAYNLNDSPVKLMELVTKHRLSRIPVYQGSIDNVVGIVYRRQALLTKPTTDDQIRQLIRQVNFVPELQRPDQLLVQLRKHGTTLAVVVDEYGGTAGLVSLEDVVGRMVGQTGDSADGSQLEPVYQMGENQWRVSGHLGIREWSAVFGPVAAPVTGISTIGGLVTANLGRMAKVGDRIALGNLLIEVEAIKGWRIEHLLLHLQKTPSMRLRHEAD